MTIGHEQRTWRWAGLIAMVVLALACAPSAEPADDDAGGSQAKGSAAPTIRHLSPAADSIVDVPSRFEWTPVEGADRYAIGVYTDVSRLLWERDDISTSSVERPQELDLDAGTYFWRVSAIRQGKQLADSGWSAFVVRREER